MDGRAWEDETGQVELRVRLIACLDDAIDPLVARLRDAVRVDDLFATQHVIVPTAGVRAFLLGRLADEFGVVANVDIGYLGLLNRLIDPDRVRFDDPWSIEGMTSVLLDIFVDGRDDPRFGAFITGVVSNHGGPLAAARHLADRFDRYAARRPQMIRAWANGVPGLAPTASDVDDDGEALSVALDTQFMPQYELWREMNSRIDADPWPVVAESLIDAINGGHVPSGLPARLTVVGLQSISLLHLRVLQALGRVIDVDVSFVHPSPTLAASWSEQLRRTIPTAGVLPLRSDPPDVPGVDPMVRSWLRGAWDLQCILASQGITLEPMTQIDAKSTDVESPRDDLLHRIQSSIAGRSVDSVDYLESDHSVRIHRCHHLSRQVEVVRTAIARSFRDLPDLRPHEVVVICADIDSAAPLLRAAFDQPFVIDDQRRVEVPLVVADRSLRQVGVGTSLVSAIVAAVSGRASIDDVLSVATSDLVLEAVGAEADDVAIWNSVIERARLRWGFDVAHRSRRGLAPEVGAVGTWESMIRSTVLGALVDDGHPRLELGGVVPLDQLEVSDIDAASRLLAVLDHLMRLEALVSTPSTVRAFAQHVGETLLRLAPADSPDTADALTLVADLAASIESQAAVTFAEFARLVDDQAHSVPGRQPLRTGTITATSMVPLRGVPYRVVCLVGFDDGVLASGETAGDDIVDAQQFAGDPDARLDSRRMILDAIHAARDRVIVTCNGRSVRNNTPIPLITQLAELVDFTQRHGVKSVRRRDGLDHAAIEIIHPRHSASTENFIAGSLVPDEPWSIDANELRTARRLIAPRESSDSSSGSGHDVQARLDDEVSFAVAPDALADLVADPLLVFVRHGLGISTWSDDRSSPDPVLPLEVSSKDAEREGDRLLEVLLGGGSLDDIDQWRDSVRLRGLLPVGAYGTAELESLESAAQDLLKKADKKGISLRELETREVSVDTPAGRVFGTIVGDFAASEPAIVYAGMSTYFHDSGRWSRRLRLGVQLLTAIASGIDVRRAISVQRHNESGKGGLAKLYQITADPAIDQEEAINRLSRLVGLYRRALITPYPDFGGAGFALATGRDEARRKFDSDLGFRFSDSREALVFGPDPDFESIYTPDGEVERFFSELAEVISVEYKNPVYVLA